MPRTVYPEPTILTPSHEGRVPIERIREAVAKVLPVSEATVSKSRTTSPCSTRTAQPTVHEGKVPIERIREAVAKVLPVPRTTVSNGRTAGAKKLRVQRRKH